MLGLYLKKKKTWDIFVGFVAFFPDMVRPLLRISQLASFVCHVSVSRFFLLVPIGQHESPAFYLPGVGLLVD